MRCKSGLKHLRSNNIFFRQINYFLRRPKAKALVTPPWTDLDFLTMSKQ